ncbi:hypothetical protein ACIQGT_36425 [Streptomyces sp. NPDC093108]|uniref:hypothetical protein n=1 Tax=Streptomyces sp. NPDC093108 TaxID=3366030 RepID=UPI00380B694C
MTAIGDLISRARLIDHPSRPEDPYDRIPGAGGLVAGDSGVGSTDPLIEAATQDLLALCEALVSRTPASALSRFVTEQLPDPDGARVLGCILQLAESEDGARSWWQYASGAGDRAASYCLYLHHLSLGENDAAAWWYEQTQPDSCPAHRTPAKGSAPDQKESQGSWTVPETVWSSDTSTPTMLRVFRRLLHRSGRRRSEVVDALMQYLPTAVAVGYVHDEPDVDLPLPGPDFAEQVGILVAAASSISLGDKPHHREGGGTHIRRRSTNGDPGEHQRAGEGGEGTV